MNKSKQILWQCLFFAAFAFAMSTGQADARGYKGAVHSDTLVFHVTYVSGDTVQVETWFAQWVGNVYSKAIEAESSRVHMSLSERIRVCESASWIAPERHIWREGDEPYLTRSQELKLQRLEHSVKYVNCQKVTEKTQGVSRRSLSFAQDWLQSRQLVSFAFDRDDNAIASVEDWILQNIPNVISIRVDRKVSGKLALTGGN